MKKLLMLSSICTLLLLASCEPPKLEEIEKLLEEIQKMVELANEHGAKVPDEVISTIAATKSSIAAYKEGKRNLDLVLAVLKLKQAGLIMNLILQKEENKSIENEVKSAQETLDRLDRYRRKQESHTTKEAP